MLGYAFCLLLLWPVGYFMTLLVTGGVANHWWSKLLQAIGGLIVGGVLLLILYTSSENDAREYNNGICPECGGEYKFSGAAGRGVSKFYYYTCGDCDHTIQVESLQK